jgi:cytochrome P450
VHELSDLVAHALIGLLSRPEQLAEVLEDPALARPAVEEAARWSSPVGMAPRLAVEATEIAGVRIPAGAIVAAVVASANRDERRWTEPARFDLHRDEGMHLAYATGAHFCLGAWVARAASALALQRLVTRLPKVRLEDGDNLGVTGWRFRDVRRLHVAWS